MICALALGVSAVGAGLIPKVVTSDWSLGGRVISEVATPILLALALGVLHLVGIWFLVREHREGRKEYLHEREQRDRRQQKEIGRDEGEAAFEHHLEDEQHRGRDPGHEQ